MRDISGESQTFSIEHLSMLTKEAPIETVKPTLKPQVWSKLGKCPGQLVIPQNVRNLVSSSWVEYN